MILPEIHIFVVLQKTLLPSTNDTYFTMKRGKSYYGGKGYYIVKFPPGEKLLYSQFSGGKGYYGGKTIQHRTDRQTDGQTDTGQSDPYVPLCFAGNTKIHNFIFPKFWLRLPKDDTVCIYFGIISNQMVKHSSSDRNLTSNGLKYIYTDRLQAL